MSILQDMMSKMFQFGKKKAGAAAPSAPSRATVSSVAPAASRPAQPTASAAPAAPAPAAPATAAPAVLSGIDVEEVLADLAAKSEQKLNWQTSIVDLMKLLGMESSLANRKALADELGFKGDKSDSAAMNIWLHKEVVKAFAANGGKLPGKLLD